MSISLHRWPAFRGKSFHLVAVNFAEKWFFARGWNPSDKVLFGQFLFTYSSEFRLLIFPDSVRGRSFPLIFLWVKMALADIKKDSAVTIYICVLRRIEQMGLPLLGLELQRFGCEHFCRLPSSFAFWITCSFIYTFHVRQKEFGTRSEKALLLDFFLESIDSFGPVKLSKEVSFWFCFVFFLQFFFVFKFHTSLGFYLHVL